MRFICSTAKTTTSGARVTSVATTRQLQGQRPPSPPCPPESTVWNGWNPQLARSSRTEAKSHSGGDFQVETPFSQWMRRCGCGRRTAPQLATPEWKCRNSDALAAEANRERRMCMEQGLPIFPRLVFKSSGSTNGLRKVFSETVHECDRIHRWLDHHGPADVCVLGLELNGHLGFNGPEENTTAVTAWCPSCALMPRCRNSLHPVSS